MAAASPKVIPIFKRSSQQATFVGVPKKPLNISEQRQAVRSLGQTLDNGWEDFFFQNLRRTRTGYTVINVCPKCGHKPPKWMHSSSWRRTHMFAHAVSAH